MSFLSTEILHGRLIFAEIHVLGFFFFFPGNISFTNPSCFLVVPNITPRPYMLQARLGLPVFSSNKAGPNKCDNQDALT